MEHTYLWLLFSSSHPVPSCPPPPSPTQLSVIMLPLLVSACFAPLVMGCVSDRMGGRRKPLVYVAGLIMIVCNIALAFNRAFGWLPYIGMLFGAVRHACPPYFVPLHLSHSVCLCFAFIPSCTWLSLIEQGLFFSVSGPLRVCLWEEGVGELKGMHESS